MDNSANSRTTIQELLNYFAYRLWTASFVLKQHKMGGNGSYGVVWNNAPSVKVNVQSEIEIVISLLAVAEGRGLSVEVPAILQRAQRFLTLGGGEWNDIVPESEHCPQVNPHIGISLPNWWEVGSTAGRSPAVCNVAMVLHEYMRTITDDVGNEYITQSFIDEMELLSQRTRSIAVTLDEEIAELSAEEIDAAMKQVEEYNLLHRLCQ